jgi:hypothetical protein
LNNLMEGKSITFESVQNTVFDTFQEQPDVLWECNGVFWILKAGFQ